MTKREQSEFDMMRARMSMAQALRWPEGEKPVPMTRATIQAALLGPHAVEVRSDYGTMRKAVKGWDYHHWNGNYSVREIVTDGNSHAGLYDGKASGWAQGGGRVFTTRADALRALRFDMTESFAANLADVDNMIKAAQ
jgi:hypothetical protein